MGDARAAENFLGQQRVKDATVELRRGFVRKVYGILTAQLLITCLIAAPLSQCPAFVATHIWLMWVSVAATLVTICAMACCRNLARSYPTNYILLFGFTIFEAVLVGFVSSQYSPQSLLLAFGATAIIFLGMTAYACLTKTDFTGCGPFLFGALMGLLAFGIVLAILSVFNVHPQVAYICYDMIGVLIFTFYVVFDTQLILGSWGGHKQEFSLDDYVFAALNLYLDIINLFLHLLRLFGDRR